MAGRTDDRAGDAPPDDDPQTAQEPAAPRTSDAAAPRAEKNTSEAEKAKTEIEAGDVADHLADFA